MTVLNPEGRPIRWAVAAPGRRAELDLPSYKPGRYFIAIDAAGQPDCAGVTYVVGSPRMATNTNTRRAKCAGARQDYSERVKARNDARKWASKGSARHKMDLRLWPKTLKRYRALAKKACGR